MSKSKPKFKPRAKPKTTSVPCIIGASEKITRHFTMDVVYKQCDRHWRQLQRIRRENVVRLRLYRTERAKDIKVAVGMLARHFGSKIQP